MPPYIPTTESFYICTINNKSLFTFVTKSYQLVNSKLHINIEAGSEKRKEISASKNI